MSWPRDDTKLERVRSLMAEEDVDALVVRAPDNVLYLSNFLPMKGYDVVVFPREGEQTLICLEPSLEDARRMAWTEDVRLFKGYAESDPRPPTARAVELALKVCRERGLERIGLELSQGTQTADRMLGEPTTPTLAYFEAFGNRVDATPLLAQARAIKTEQELERMRLANELAALALEQVRANLRAGMTEAEVAAAWEGAVHARGTGYEGKVENARGYSLVWSGPGIKTFTATSDRPICEHEPTLFEIWVSADGYWCDHTKNLCPGELDPRYAELEEQLLDVYGQGVAHCRDGADLAELDRLIRAGIAAAGYPGQPSHPVAHGVGARAHEPPYAHQAGSGTIRKGMVLAIEPGIYWEGGGGLRVEDNWLVTDDAPEKLCSFPDGIVRIEAGFPRVSEDDARAIKLIAGAGLNAEIWGFSRAVQADVEALVELGVRYSVIEAPVSDLKLEAYGVEREVMLERIRKAVSFAAEHDITVAYFGVDGTRAELDFLERAYTTAVEAGAREAVVVDTLGIATPEAAAYLVERVSGWVDVPIHWHGHNDFGLATAAAVAAVQAGAKWIQGTINGMGERAGNASLAEVALALDALYGIRTNLRLDRARDVSERVRELSGYELEPWKPLVGDTLFRRESGAVASQFHDPPSIEPYAADLVGAERSLVLGKKSGLDSIRIKCAELGLEVAEERYAELLARVKQLGAEKGGLVTDEEFRQLVATRADA